MSDRPSRTSLAEHLPEHECWQMLRRAEVGRLAVSTRDRSPEVFPLNYVVDHGTVVFRTTDGTKLKLVRQRPAVTFEVDGVDEAGHAWSVVLKGAAEEIKRLSERVEGETLPLYPWHLAPKAHLVRIVPGEVSGRRFAIARKELWATPVSGVLPAADE